MSDSMFYVGMSFRDAEGCEWFVKSVDYEKDIFSVETDTCLSVAGKPILETKYFTAKGLSLFVSHVTTMFH